jgi:hypothetical protein
MVRDVVRVRIACGEVVWVIVVGVVVAVETAVGAAE